MKNKDVNIENANLELDIRRETEEEVVLTYPSASLTVSVCPFSLLLQVG